VDCKEFQEHVTEAVDRRLSGDRMKAFLHHAGACPACRDELEAETLTKNLVCSRLAMVRTPASVMAAITTRLREEQASPAGALRTWWQRITTSVYFRPAVAFAVAAFAILFLVRTSADHSTGNVSLALVPGNVIDQSMTNYLGVVNRTILPQIANSERETVLDFFKGKTEFPVLLPRMKECELIGGVANEYAGVKLAHVVYRHQKEVVYIYQACWEEVQKGARLQLPADVRDELKATGWYSASQPNGYAIVLWTKGRTLCSAVAHMSREELLACLTDGEPTTAQPW
jgi:anti-sigma factor RsiW